VRTVATEPAAARAEAATRRPILELDDVAVRLGRRTIFEHVSLRVDPGEFIAVLGPNGAGKSTLMRAILGLVPLAAGRATVLGTSPQDARDQIGYLPQRRNLDQTPRIRGVDVVGLGLDGDRWGVPLPLTRHARQRRRAERRRIDEVIALVAASAYAERPLGELSGGEQQRLLIAQALVRRPPLLILDEPLDSLDLPNQAAVAALLGRVCAAEGVATILVAHDVNPLLGYLQRVAYIAGGHAVAGTVEEVITAPTLSALYGTPIEVLRASDGRMVVVGEPEAPHHHGHRHG
jgi:zinc/manganese transport system ATP-binding protein